MEVGIAVEVGYFLMFKRDAYMQSLKFTQVSIDICIRDRRFLPQVLFVCTSGKEGGRGLKPRKTENLRKNLRKTCRGGVLINKI